MSAPLPGEEPLPLDPGLTLDQRIEEAATTIRVLFAKYGIAGHWGAHDKIRERFTQEDFDTYQRALHYLNDQGVIG